MYHTSMSGRGRSQFPLVPKAAGTAPSPSPNIVTECNFFSKEPDSFSFLGFQWTGSIINVAGDILRIFYDHVHSVLSVQRSLHLQGKEATLHLWKK